MCPRVYLYVQLQMSPHMYLFLSLYVYLELCLGVCRGLFPCLCRPSKSHNVKNPDFAHCFVYKVYPLVYPFLLHKTI